MLQTVYKPLAVTALRHFRVAYFVSWLQAGVRSGSLGNPSVSHIAHHLIRSIASWADSESGTRTFQGLFD